MLGPLSLIAWLALARTGLASTDMNRDFKMIEEHLVAKVDSEDLEPNLRELERWAEDPGKQICGLRLCNRRPETALRTFLALRESLDAESKCSQKTYNLLRACRDACGIDDQWFVTWPREYRVRELLVEIGKELADSCASDISAKFESKLDSLDEGLMHALDQSFWQLKNFIFEEIRDFPAGKTSDSRMKFLFDYYFGLDVFVGGLKSFFSSIERVQLPKISGLTKRARRAELEEQVRGFLQKTFLIPCEYYLSSMREVAEPFLDIFFTGYDFSYQPREGFAEDLLEFLGSYYMCKKFKGRFERTVAEMVDFKQ